MKRNKTLSEEYHSTNGINYKIIYEKIKNTYIHIKDGIVIVKTPKYTDIKYIESIVNDKKSWIERKVQ